MPGLKPKGVLTRTPPDWMARQMVSIGWYNEFNFTFPRLGILNNATDGSYFYIYDVMVRTSAAATVFYTAQVYNPSVGSNSPPTPILAGSPQLPGIFTFDSGELDNTQFVWEHFSAGNEAIHLGQGWPLCILPPLWAMQVGSRASADANFSVRFVYMVGPAPR